MATLYVENVPDELYEALRARARQNRNSMAAEVVALLRENVPTEAELSARQNFARKMSRFRSQKSSSPRGFPSAEEMIREDRER
jgi:plasmid stability protein